VRNCTVFHGHGGFVIGSEMSGGARNIYVSDCDFIGTDVGLRFKTTRGRGGMVEKIYIDNVRMVRIGGAAILFDMYYMAKDPLAPDEDPQVRSEPVTEATPQFRDFHIRQIDCKGAETAVFIRGLPEMNIAGIEISDMVAQSTKGIVCQEGDGIILRNVSLTGSGKHVVEITNSQNVLLQRVASDTPDVLMQVKGNRSKNIRLVDARASRARKEVEMGEEVLKGAVLRK
jgi:DNA sulfur modification protein DndE